MPSASHAERLLPSRALSRRARWIACAAIAAFAIGATPAGAAVSITSFQITKDMPAYPASPADGPSTVQAGANPDAGFFWTFAYPDASEDLRTATVDFGPGLLWNPESVPACAQALLEAGGAACPPASVVGASRLDANVAGTTIHAESLPGTLYNAEPLGSEPTRLVAVTFRGPSTVLLSSIPFTITPRGGGDYGMTGALTDLPRLNVPSPDLQVVALGLVVNGAANRFVRNPTSCLPNVSTGGAAGYDNPGSVAGPGSTFVPAGCDQVPFEPQVSVSVGDRGSTTFNKFPPFVFRFTQAAGEADIKGNKVTLPIELNTNNPAYQLCTQAQANSDTCPAASKFGWVTAHSPFLAGAVEGPVYLIQRTSSSLPGLLLDFRGRVPVKVQTETSLVKGRQIQSLVLNAPQLPVSDITIALNGGRKTGVFLNRENLCFKGNSTTRFNAVTGLVKSYGWNGRQTGDQRYRATVNGCGPAVKAGLQGATGSRPRLTVTVQKHPEAQAMQRLALTLGRNLSLVRSRIGDGGSAAVSGTGAALRYAGPHRLVVTGLPAAGAGKVTIKLRDGAVRVTGRARKALGRGQPKGFTVKVAPTPVSGKPTSTKARFTVKGR